MVIARRVSKQGRNGAAKGVVAPRGGRAILPANAAQFFFLVLATLMLILRVVCFKSLAKEIFVTCLEF
jgi:hypothetical protein